MKKVVKALILLIFINSCSYIFNSKKFNNKQAGNNSENEKRGKCYNCEGKGKTKCPRCKGGKQLHNFTLKGHELIECERCQGEGFSICEGCKGTGKYKEKDLLKRNIELEI